MKLKKPQETDFSVNIDEVLPLLNKVKKMGRNQFQAECPSHQDDTPSLSVGSTTDGKVLLHCHAGCSYLDIITELGLYKEPTNPQKREIKEIYPYVDENGELLYEVIRFEPKAFGQRRSDGADGYIWNLKGVRRVLYHLPQLINSEEDYVFIVEGEKDCHTLESLGFIATTNSGGGSKWNKEFNKYFKGKDVIILPDQDKTGEEHAEIVAKNLYHTANSVRIINLQGLKEKQDVTDWVNLDPESSVETLKVLVGDSAPVEFDEDELDIDNSLPSSLDSEEAIIGAIFSNPKLAYEVFETLEPKDFFNNKTRIIVRAIFTCFNDKTACDLVTVSDTLRREKKLENIGGLKYLKELKDAISDILNLHSWISIVKEKSDFRFFIKLANKLGKEAQGEGNNPEAIGEEIVSAISKLKSANKDNVTHLSSGVFDVLDKIRNQAENEITGFRTNFVELDEILGGLQKTDLIILAARPSMGKTASAFQIAYNVAKQGIKTLFFSLEMSKEQLLMRILCSEARVDSINLKNNNLSASDWERIANVIPDLQNANFFVDDTPAITLNHVRNKLMKAVEAEEPYEFIVIDYLQLMTSSVGGSRQEQISQLSRDLKSLAKEFGISELVLSQMSRAVESRNPPIPVMSDLRESGSIEQDADVVGFLYREDYYQEDTERKGITDFIVAKNRNGPTGTVNLAFIKKFTRFDNLFLFEPNIRI